jgi:hypothetical protein
MFPNTQVGHASEHIYNQPIQPTPIQDERHFSNPKCISSQDKVKNNWTIKFMRMCFIILF